MNPHACLAMIATLLAGLCAAPAMAADLANKQKTAGQLIEECMRDLERGQTAGRKKMTPQQRMTAEAQCRARAEAELASQKS